MGRAVVRVGGKAAGRPHAVSRGEAHHLIRSSDDHLQQRIIADIDPAKGKAHPWRAVEINRLGTRSGVGQQVHVNPREVLRDGYILHATVNDGRMGHRGGSKQEQGSKGRNRFITGRWIIGFSGAGAGVREQG